MANPNAAYHADVIGSVYSARTSELIYRHQRSQLESDDDITSSITRIVEQRIQGDTLLRQIQTRYERLKTLKFQQYLRHIRARFERIPGQGDGDEPLDPHIHVAEMMLTHYVGLVEQLLTLDLADRMYKPHSVAKLIT
jgi:hypothetical protein